MTPICFCQSVSERETSGLVSVASISRAAGTSGPVSVASISWTAGYICTCSPKRFLTWITTTQLTNVTRARMRMVGTK